MLTTRRLNLSPIAMDDAPALYDIYSDECTWRHNPPRRFTDPAQMTKLVNGLRQAWLRDGLSHWTIRCQGSQTVLGHAGCFIRKRLFWCLGYCVAPNAYGRGYATEVSLAAVAAAHETRSDIPVVAFMLSTIRYQSGWRRRLDSTCSTAYQTPGTPTRP